MAWKCFLTKRNTKAPRDQYAAEYHDYDFSLLKAKYRPIFTTISRHIIVYGIQTSSKVLVGYADESGTEDMYRLLSLKEENGAMSKIEVNEVFRFC